MPPLVARTVFCSGQRPKDVVNLQGHRCVVSLCCPTELCWCASLQCLEWTEDHSDPPCCSGPFETPRVNQLVARGLKQIKFDFEELKKRKKT